MRYQGQRSRVLERARDLNLRGVSHDGKVYTCHECGSQWPASERYAWWPIRLRWSVPSPRPRSWSWLAVWGAQIGADGIEQKVFARFVRVGPLVIQFGWREAYR